MKNPFKRGPKEAPAPKVKFLTPQDVWKAPADFNRATRRSVGLLGRIWKWNPPQGIGAGGRYARRHYEETKFLHPKTRRQRRHKARIMRAIKKGLS